MAKKAAKEWGGHKFEKRYLFDTLIVRRNGKLIEIGGPEPHHIPPQDGDSRIAVRKYYTDGVRNWHEDTVEKTENGETYGLTAPNAAAYQANADDGKLALPPDPPLEKKLLSIWQSLQGEMPDAVHVRLVWKSGEIEHRDFPSHAALKEWGATIDFNSIREFHPETHPFWMQCLRARAAVSNAQKALRVARKKADLAKALRIGMELGLEVGLSLVQLEAIRVTPKATMANDMNQSRAASRPKSKTMHLKDELARWLRVQDVDASKESLAARFFEYAKAAKEEYRVTGRHASSAKSSIRHKRDKVGLKLTTLARIVIPTLLKSFSETRSAEPGS